jgi:hypothetical protein
MIGFDFQIKGDDRRQIYSHLTNATNSQNIGA